MTLAKLVVVAVAHKQKSINTNSANQNSGYHEVNSLIKIIMMSCGMMMNATRREEVKNHSFKVKKKKISLCFLLSLFSRFFFLFFFNKRNQ